MDSKSYGRPIFGKNTGTASSQPAATATAAKHAAPANTIAKYKYRPEPKLSPKDKALFKARAMTKSQLITWLLLPLIQIPSFKVSIASQS